MGTCRNGCTLMGCEREDGGGINSAGWTDMNSGHHTASVISVSDRSSIDINPAHESSTDNTPLSTQKFIRASICLKLTIFVGLLVVLASGIPALVLWLKTHEQLVNEIERRLLTVSTLRQEQLKDYLDSERDKAGLIASRVLINNLLSHKPGANNKNLAEYDLSLAISVISDFVCAAIYDEEGNLVLSTGESWGPKIMETMDVTSLVKQPDHLMVGHPLLTSKGWIYNMSHPIYQNTTLIGVLLTWVNASKLGALVYDRTGLQRTGELLVGIPQNSNLVHLLFPALQNINVTMVQPDGAMARAIAGESGVLRQRDYSGESIIAAYTPVEFMHWGLVAKLDVYEAYAPVQSVRIVIITTIIVLVALGVMASLGLAKVFTNPIIELGRAAASLGEGHMRTRARKGTFILRDEIADLMDTFNSMAHEIASNQIMLEHKVEERTLDLARANDGLAKEIEERRRIEAELQKAKDTADDANRSKSEFLANMSHEIRTPLNAIINFTELCLDTQLTPEQKEYLDYVSFASQHLLRLITDILDFSKIEAGKLQMEEVQFSLYDQLEHAVSVLAARALQSGLELCCCIASDVPDQIKGDPGRLLQIFVNLIGNAIKFTEKGEVVVYASVENRNEDSVELMFGVKDTGLGIPPEKQSLLFKAFSQVDSSTHRLYGGTGLGLVISAKLASAMNGRMWVESAGIKGQGSTFLFRAKFGIVESNLCPHVYSFKDAKALVVDNSDTICQVLVALLQGFEMIADSVTTVEAAQITLTAASQSGAKYNVVLLDMQLEGTPADELVHFLRQEPDYVVRYTSSSEAEREDGESSTSAHSCALDCIIMLTSVNNTDTARCKELGIACHISKPIKRALLVRSLHEVLGIKDKYDMEGKTVKADNIPSKSLYILVVEDNLINQRVAAILLGKWGHTFVMAKDGEEAVEQWMKEDFDIVLMDVQMPVCDGFQATKKIRELEKKLNRHKHTPIVAMTAHAMSGDGDRCIASGMDFYISKPLNAKKLQELIQVVGAQGQYTVSSIWVMTCCVPHSHRQIGSATPSTAKLNYVYKCIFQGLPKEEVL